jgi:single-strand DNA-binding protein
MATKSLNRAIIVGNLGKDPDTREVGGRLIANLLVATSTSWKGKDGQWQDNTQWHNVVVWHEQAAQFFQKNGRKGQQVCIEGTIETRKWQDQKGNDRYSTEINVRPFGGSATILSKLESLGEGHGDQGGDKSAPIEDDMDDSIPF